MHQRALAFLLLLAAIGYSPLLAGADFDAHDVVDLGHGVYGVVWKDGPVHPEPNVLFVVNDDDVLVVDSSLLPSTSRLVIGEIRKLTSKPVRYLINTHWHDDHVNANFVYQDTWPDVQIIAHENTRLDAHTRAFGQAAQDLADNKQRLAMFQEILRSGKRSDGTPLDDAARARVENLVTSARRYDQEIPGVREVLPNVTIDRSLVLHSGSRTIEVRYLGRGNTRGDVVVWLPAEKILATGDLVVSPSPFAFGSYYAEWIDTLEALTRFDASTIFLSHGAPQHDFSYVHQMQGLLHALVDRVGAEVEKGKSLEDVQKTVRLDDWKQKLAGDDKLLQYGFDAFFVTPAVERAYYQIKGEAQ